MLLLKQRKTSAIPRLFTEQPSWETSTQRKRDYTAMISHFYSGTRLLVYMPGYKKASSNSHISQ